MKAVASRLRARLAEEEGYSLVELLTVVLILGIVLGSLTMIFVRASNAELDLNRRFRAQEHARMAMDKLRREIHCSTGVTPTGSSTAITITISGLCPTSGGFTTIRWCVLPPPGAATGRYALYRSTASTCTTSTGVKWADYLRSQMIFTYTMQSSASLASLAVNFNVNLKTTGTQGQFNLRDVIVLRNSSRTCIVGSPSPPC